MSIEPIARCYQDNDISRYHLKDFDKVLESLLKHLPNRHNRARGKFLIEVHHLGEVKRYWNRMIQRLFIQNKYIKEADQICEWISKGELDLPLSDDLPPRKKIKN